MRKRVLIVSPTPTHPTTAGNRARILALVKALQAMGHEVHFALATLAEPDMDAMHDLLGSGLHILKCRAPHAIRSPLPRVRRRVLRKLGSEAAYLWRLDDFYDPALTPQLAALCERESFDIAIVEYVFMSKAFDAIPASALKVLDTHDHFALRHRRFLETGQIPQWFSTTPEEETIGFRRADCVLAIQDQEAAAFVRQLRGDARRVITVGHLLDVRERTLPAGPPSAVFLASANPINIDAARYFIDNVMPLVHRHEPNFKLILAGDVCNAFDRRSPSLRCLGRVPTVVDAFAETAVAVNPVRLGTGLNIKMLDALACGVACVSSHTGSRGLERHRGLAFESVADDDPAKMAAAVLSLLTNRERAVRLAAAGLQLAMEWNDDQLASLRQLLRTTEKVSRENAA
jgi:glycosyltransferase involved in cell wall biosynthesis